jgi:hypothetical protein
MLKWLGVMGDPFGMVNTKLPSTYRGPLLHLPAPPCLEGGHRRRVELEHTLAGAHASPGPPTGPVSHVHVGPTEAEQFSAPHANSGGQAPRSRRVVTGCTGQKGRSCSGDHTWNSVSAVRSEWAARAGSSAASATLRVR